MPVESDCTFWIIDECFSKNTMITLSNGEQIPIQNIKVGDAIQNLCGIDKVVNKFINQVPLERVLSIHFTNGFSTVCSEEHLFLTPEGWIPAKKLMNSFVFLKNISNFMEDKGKLITERNDKNKKKMSKVWITFKEKSKKILLYKMFNQIYSKTCKIGKQNMCYLWSVIQESLVLTKCYVWQNLWKQIRGREKKRLYFFKRKKETYISITQKNVSNKRRRYSKEKNINTYDKKQPHPQSEDCIKNKRDKKNKWNTSYLEREKRRKWTINPPTNNISIGVRMGNGIFNKNKTFPFRWFWISSKIYSRFSQSRLEISNRSRWRGTLKERRDLIRLEKREEIERIRVESITFYEQGSNTEYFKGIIEDKERNQGYVEFYDLEIKNHHSYMANNILVHNCHKLTNDAQNALLKILEDTPDQVYFVLCTTEPQKLLATIKGRCIQLEVKPLSEEEMLILLRGVVKREQEELDQEVYDIIIRDSTGLPRNALQILEQVLNASPEDRLKVAEQAQFEYSQAIELCRALLNKSPWKVVNKILSGLKEQEAESIRRIVLGYCQAILLKTDNWQAGLVMEEFINPFYDSGFPQLIYACYSIIKTK